MQANVNRVVSFWDGDRNVGVLSGTDDEFLEKLAAWAEGEGYEVRETGRSE